MNKQSEHEHEHNSPRTPNTNKSRTKCRTCSELNTEQNTELNNRSPNTEQCSLPTLMLRLSLTSSLQGGIPLPWFLTTLRQDDLLGRLQDADSLVISLWDSLTAQKIPGNGLWGAFVGTGVPRAEQDAEHVQN